MSVFFSVLGKKGKQNKQKKNLTKSKLGCAWKGNKKQRRSCLGSVTLSFCFSCVTRAIVFCFFFVLRNNVFVSKPVRFVFSLNERLPTANQSNQ